MTTIAQLIVRDNSDDENIIIDYRELMSDAADSATHYRAWTDEYGCGHGEYVFADDSTLILSPDEVTIR